MSQPSPYTVSVGNTGERPENPQKGAIRFNTDTKHLEYFIDETIERQFWWRDHCGKARKERERTRNVVEEAIASTGYKNRLIGQGNVELFNERLAERLGMDLRTLRQSLAAVAEFKGEVYNHASCKGVGRFVQVDEETATFEADVLGLEEVKEEKVEEVQGLLLIILKVAI